MPPDKAQFGSRDPTPATFEEGKLGQKKYMGPERRRNNRREAAERRIEVRFELGATDRRENHGRRESDETPQFW